MSSPKSWSGESTCRCENHTISCHHVTSPLGDFHDRMWFPLCNILNERVCDTQDSLGDKKNINGINHPANGFAHE